VRHIHGKFLFEIIGNSTNIVIIDRGWIPKSNIVPFGNFDTDVAMLHQAKKTRKAHRIKEVKAGYRHACELIHIDPQSRLDQVFKR
jgi:hypothetical protein